jgi:release factor glutamine methyltransferase
MSPKKVKLFLKKVFQRSLGKPISKIFGRKEFYSRSFFVNSHTLSPRPESELIIEIIKKKELGKKRMINILDLGCGSGCLIISLILELSKKRVVYGTGVDFCPRALKVAVKNSKFHSVKKYLNFFKSFWFSNITKKFDIIVSNPPYIKQNEIKNLADDVKKYDPIIALNGGLTGLDAFKKIAKDAKKHLKPNGYICVEIGFDQKKQVKKIFEKENFITAARYKDYEGRDRVMIFKNKI